MQVFSRDDYVNTRALNINTGSCSHYPDLHCSFELPHTFLHLPWYHLHSICNQMWDPRSLSSSSLTCPHIRKFNFIAWKHCYQTPVGQLITLWSKERHRYCLSFYTFRCSKWAHKASPTHPTDLFSSNAPVSGQQSLLLIPSGGEAKANNDLFPPCVNTHTRSLKFFKFSSVFSALWVLTNRETAILKNY